MKKGLKRFLALAAAAAMLAGSMTAVSADDNNRWSGWTAGTANSGYEAAISYDADGNMVMTASKCGDQGGQNPVIRYDLPEKVDFAGKKVAVRTRLKIDKNSDADRVYLKINRPDTDMHSNDVGGNIYALWYMGYSNKVWYTNGVGNDKVSTNFADSGMAHTSGQWYDVVVVIDGDNDKLSFVFEDEANKNIVTYSDKTLPATELADDTALESLSFTYRKGTPTVTFSDVSVTEVDETAVFASASAAENTISITFSCDVLNTSALDSITVANSAGKAVTGTASYNADTYTYTLTSGSELASDAYTITFGEKVYLENGVSAQPSLTANVTSKDIVVNDTFENETDLTNWTSRNSHATISKETEDGNSFARVTINSMDKATDLTGEDTHPVITRKLGGGLERQADGYTVIETKVRWSDDTYRNYFKLNYPTEKGALLLWDGTESTYRYDNGYGDVTQNFFTLWWRYTNQMRMYYVINKSSGFTLVGGSNGQMYNNATVDYVIGDNDENKWYTVRMVFDNAKDTLSTVLYDEEGNVITSVTDTNANIWYLDDYIYTLDFTARQTSTPQARCQEVRLQE